MKRLNRLVVACSAFMVAFLFAPGCAASAPGDEQNVLARPFTLDGGDHNHLVNPSQTMDAGARPFLGSVRVPLPSVFSVPSVDASTATTDGARSADAGLHVERPPPTPGLPVGVVLAPTTCHGRRLPASTELLRLASAGMTLWHLCYKTPTVATSDHAFGHLRPASVRVDVLDEDGARVLARADAPRIADPWTASVLIALPTNQPAALSLTNLYADGRTLSVVNTGLDGRFPMIHGDLQAWKVAADGTQSDGHPTFGCRDPVQPEGRPMSFLPFGSCPNLERDCPALNPLGCRPF